MLIDGHFVGSDILQFLQFYYNRYFTGRYFLIELYEILKLFSLFYVPNSLRSYTQAMGGIKEVKPMFETEDLHALADSLAGKSGPVKL